MAAKDRRSDELARRRLAEQRLAVYLNDHLAGSTAGIELAKRAARAQRDSREGNGEGGELERLAREIDLDRHSLLRIMELLEVPVQRYKTRAGWAAEKVGRLKPNRRLLRRSGLSTVVELEALRLGVEGKVLLWRALTAVASSDSRLDPKRLEELEDRARQQRDSLQSLHTAAVGRLLVRGE